MDYICDPVSNPFDDEPGSGLVRIGGGNTAFYNNGIGIKFLERDPIIYSGLTWSGNILYDCNFNSDELRDYHYSTTSANSYPNEQNPWAGYANSSRRTDAGIHIEGIYRMSIRHCEFDNNQHGILSFDSKYDVFDCDFTNAHFGIKINNVNSGVDFNHEISRCYFDRIPGYEPPSPPYYFKLFTSAIYIRAGKNDYIHDNDFGHIETDQELNQYGIFTNSTSSFRITENVFRKFKHGIKISNSGDDGGFVGAEETTYSYWEGNRFNAAWRSITTGGDNSKLKLKCNVCDNNLALYQPELYDVNYKNYGNLADQGLPSSPYSLWNYKKPAGNEFYPENEPDYKTLWSNYPYTYYRHAGPPEVIPYEADVSDPINIFSNNVEKPEENNIACSPIYYPTPIEIPSLPFTYSTNPGYMSPPYNLLDSLSYQKDSLQLILETVNSNLDNGKTFELLSDIHGNAPQGKLKNMLIVNSPLSDTVIHALLTEYPLAHGNFKNVMEYNLPVRKHLRSLLYTVLDQIPQGIAQQLYVLQANNPSFNTPGQLEHEINSVTIERQMLLNHLLILLNDTVHNRREDAIFLLENEESLSAEKTLISTHIADGDYDLAASKLNALPTGDPDNADFVSLHQMLLSNYEQGNTLYQLDSSEIELIQTLAYQCPVNLASANAQSILYYLFREVVPECPAQMGTKNMPLAEEHPVITGAKTD
ncbi:MAG TPA: right-handed parallel beta-helix repeat-containing protein, partial [Spirochaetota bacterium]|nr:right-handed parallel beta-helix repeat-containing protein [Spirochaetota bacterium]